MAERKAMKRQERIERQKRIDEYVRHFPDPSESVKIDLTPELLAAKFDELNAKYFEGKLERPLEFRLKLDKYIFASVFTAMEHGKFTNLHMTFSTIVNWDEYFLEKNMLHEMIHISVCQENGENVEPAHGDKFYFKMFELNDKFGLNLRVGEPGVITKRYIKPEYILKHPGLSHKLHWAGKWLRYRFFRLPPVKVIVFPLLIIYYVAREFVHPSGKELTAAE